MPPKTKQLREKQQSLKLFRDQFVTGQRDTSGKSSISNSPIERNAFKHRQLAETDQQNKCSSFTPRKKENEIDFREEYC